MLGLTLDILRAAGINVSGGGGPSYSYTPPLDLYPADIAYSVRKLSSSYSGPCMEVERVADAATLDIGFDSNGLLDTQAIIDFSTAGGGTGEIRVRTWYDQTGNSRHALQTIGSEMSYIYGGGSIREVNGKPVVDPIYGGDGLYYIQGTYSTASNNTIFTVISPGLTGGSYVMSRYSGAFTQGILGAGIEEPISGWNSGIDFGFGTTQYYRDGAFYGSGTTLQRNDIMQSVLAGRRIMGIGFTQSGLTEPLLRLGRDAASSIYATQEYIVYFSDQLGTVPRTALEGNINSYYQVANLPDYTSGFLADYPDAAAAYSVRQLSNTAIKCMRVRRAVAPFDELDIGFDSNGDLDTAAISTFGGSDVLVVSRWYDQSGQSNHAVPNSSTAQPQIYNGTAVITENGKPALQFDGVNDLFDFPASYDPNFYYSVFAVRQSSTVTGIFLGSKDSNRYWADFGGNNDTVNTFLQDGFNGGSLTTDYAIYRKNGAAAFSTTTTRAQYGAAFYNGNQILMSFLTDGTAFGSAFTSLRIGGYTGGASPFNGTVQELIMYQSTTGNQSGNASAIETNISDYYTIIINPDAPTSGFLFDYSGAAAAYSVRQLNNNAEYCMQVERSDGERLYVGFVAGELDTQAIIDFAGASAATVYRWFDQTGNQNHAVVSQQPVTIYDGTSIISRSGIPAVQNGTNVGYMTFSGISIPASGGYTTFAAKGAQTNWGGVISGGWYPRSSGQGWIVSGNTTIDAFFTSGLFGEMVMTARKDVNDYDMWRNTTSLYSNTLGTAYGAGFVELFRGEPGDPNSTVDDGLLHEAIFYDSALAYATVTNIQNNLITHYSL